MDTRQTFILGALVAITGVIVGVGSVVSASRSLASTGYNSTAAKEMVDWRLQGPTPLDAYEALLDKGTPDTLTYKRLIQKEGGTHAAAPGEFDISNCEGLSGTRLTHCIVEYVESGVEYQHGQTGD